MTIEEVKTKLVTTGLKKGDPEWEEFLELIRLNWVRMTKFNNGSYNTPEEVRKAASEFLGYELHEGSRVLPPFRCDLGFNVRLGKNTILNYNTTFLDTAEISIGDNTWVGPDCSFVTACHPMDYEKRRTWEILGKPIRVGEDCWICANVTIIPGVTIGDRCVIGAGAVVTKDVPDDSVVAGNPARNIH